VDFTYQDFYPDFDYVRHPKHFSGNLGQEGFQRVDFTVSGFVLFSQEGASLAPVG
jgi:hypothetical protein